MLSDTLTGCGDSTGVVSHRDFDFLRSIVDGFHLHLGYEAAVYIAHYGTSPYNSILFFGPYITQIIRHMGLLQGTYRMRIIEGFAAMSLETLSSIGLLQ